MQAIICKIRDFIDDNISIFYAVIIIASLLLFGKVIGFAYFNSWDDGIHVAGNYWVVKRTVWESLQYFWTNIHKGLYIPLTYSAWKLIWVAIEPLRNSEKAMVYHFLCLLFHTINACLVFKIFTKLNLPKVSALFGALIFLVNPVQVESFAWISEFKGLFAFFWGAAAAICFINWKNTDKKLPYFLAVLFFAFSLLSKPSAVTLPILFAAIWFFVEEKRPFSKTNFKHFSLIFVFFSMAAVLAVITRIAQPASMNIYRELPVYTRIIIPLHALGFYLSQLIIPAPLVSVYPDQLPADVVGKISSQFYWLLGLLAIILPVRYKSFRWIWLFELLILPNSGIIPFDYQFFSVVADRYQYLPMPVAIFGFLKHLGILNAVKKVVIIVIIAIFSLMASIRTNDWKNSATLHYSALQYNKKTEALYVNLNEFLVHTNQYELVKKVMELADSNKIEGDKIHITRAFVLELCGKKDSAKVIYQKIISDFLDSNGNLRTEKRKDILLGAIIRRGNIAFSEKNYDSAIFHYNTFKIFVFAKKEPDYYVDVCESLAKTYIVRSQSDSAKDGDLDSSLAFSSKILSFEKENAAALYYKGLAFYLQDNNDSALVYLEQYLKKIKSSGAMAIKIQEFIEEYIKANKKASDFKNSDLKSLMPDNNLNAAKPNE